MKKKIFSILLVIVLSIAFVYMAVGCDTSLRKAKKARYVEYTEINGKIYFRGLYDGGYGYIVLGGEKVPAEFSFGMSSIEISILAEDAPKEFTGNISSQGKIMSTSDWFEVYDLNDNDQIRSMDEEVELFGEKFERIVLTLNRLDADDFDAWEYGDYWKSNTSDDYTVVNFAQYYLRQGADKCAEIAVKKSADANKEYYIFKWLPEEKGFEIYVRENDEQYVPQEGQVPVSTGTYEKKGEKFNETVTLTFTTDGIFDGKYPTLELVRKY